MDSVAAERDAVALLERLCRRPSVSAEGGALAETADLVEGLLRDAGFETRQLVVDGGPPAIWGELRGTGVDALVIEPGPTKTEFQSVAGEAVGDDHGEPAENVVRVALDALGKQPSVISGWFNWVRANAVRLVPRSTATIIAKKVIEGQTPVELR